jgi:hypothetical protein
MQSSEIVTDAVELADSATPRSPVAKRVLLAEPRGYCAGVGRAVETPSWLTTGFVTTSCAQHRRNRGFRTFT